MRERRQFHRACAVEEGFVISANNTTLDDGVYITVQDLSVSGISFFCPYDFDVGDVLKISFSLFVDYTICARAKILRASDHIYHCKFFRLTGVQETKVAAYVNYKKSEERTG